jgi:hypothetical protein
MTDGVSDRTTTATTDGGVVSDTDESASTQGTEDEPASAEPSEDESADAAEDFDPIGTVALIAIYMAIVIGMWIFTYFVEFLGRSVTIVG